MQVSLLPSQLSTLIGAGEIHQAGVSRCPAVPQTDPAELIEACRRGAPLAVDLGGEISALGRPGVGAHPPGSTPARRSATVRPGGRRGWAAPGRGWHCRGLVVAQDIRLGDGSAQHLQVRGVGDHGIAEHCATQHRFDSGARIPGLYAGSNGQVE